jgi:hypothetical protein
MKKTVQHLLHLNKFFRKTSAAVRPALPTPTLEEVRAGQRGGGPAAEQDFLLSLFKVTPGVATPGVVLGFLFSKSLPLKNRYIWSSRQAFLKAR